MLNSLSSDQKRILLVLSLINLINYLDRQVVFPLFGHIKAEFHVSDFELGLLASVFMLVHSIASLPLGILADKMSRRLIIAAGVGFWSVMTFFSGFAASFKQLLGIRGAVGIGESAYGPAATAMISDNLPESFWSRAQGVFNGAMMIGGTLGAMIGGLAAFYLNDWRLAFFIVSPVGLLLAFWAYRLPDARVLKHHEPLNIKRLGNNKAFWWIIVSGIFATLASGAYITWGVEFISRYKGMNLRDAGLVLGIILMAAGLLGVALGGMIADHLHKKFTYGRSLTVAISLSLSAPFMYLGVSEGRQWLFLVFFFIGTALFSVYHAPVTAVMHEVVPKNLRSSAFAVYVLIIHLIGDTLAPAIIGRLSDSYGLLKAMQWTSLAVLLSGLVFFIVTYLIKHGKVVMEEKEAIEIIS
jgi:MFS family permease